MFAEVREVAPDAILATNTSSLSVEEMGADVGLHFFNPVAVMPLVEIVRTPQTTDEELATAWDVVKKLKKRGVLVSDAPGFVVNRVLTRMTRVLIDALENGNTVEETDEAMLSLGLPMAPSVLLQMVGPRVANHVLETMHDAYPDRFPLSPTLASYRRRRRRDRASPATRAARVDEIREDVLEAVADEIRHLLDEGVVGAAGRRRRLPDPRRRLSLLPRRDHEAPRPDGHLRAGLRLELAEYGKIPVVVAATTTGSSIEIDDEHAGGLLDRLGARAERRGRRARRASSRRAARRLARRRRALRLRRARRAEAEQRALGRSRPSSATTRSPRSRARSSTGSTTRTAGTTSRRARPGKRRRSSAATPPGRCASSWPRTRDARDARRPARAGGLSPSSGAGVPDRRHGLEGGRDALAARVHGEVEPGGELVWETVPGNPFAVFGGLGGSGTPIG